MHKDHNEKKTDTIKQVTLMLHINKSKCNKQAKQQIKTTHAISIHIQKKHSLQNALKQQNHARSHTKV